MSAIRYIASGLAAISLTSLTFLTACSEQEAPVDENAEVRPVKIFRVQSSDDTLLRKFPARVHSAERAELAFRVPGELQKLPVTSGSEVRAGSVLAALDASDYKIALNDRKARYQLAEAQFNRMKGLRDKSQVSQAQFDQALAELDISKAALAAARTDLSYTKLKAPFSGVVAEVFVDNHQPVAAGQTVVMLQVPDQLDIRMEVPENIMVRIAQDRKDYQPEVEFEALPGKRFHARYKEHNAQADTATGSFTVSLTLPRPPELNLLPGMSASVYVDLNQILTDSTQSVMIPVQAVMQTADQTEGSSDAQVWIVNPDMTLSARKVTVGKIAQNGIEIQQGLQSGEQVLAAGVHQAREGMRVRPWVQERGL